MERTSASNLQALAQSLWRRSPAPGTVSGVWRQRTWCQNAASAGNATAQVLAASFSARRSECKFLCPSSLNLLRKFCVRAARGSKSLSDRLSEGHVASENVSVASEWGVRGELGVAAHVSAMWRQNADSAGGVAALRKTKLRLTP